MVAAGVGSEVADSGLAGRPAVVGVEVGDGVIQVDSAADGGGVGKHISGVAQLELFPQRCWDLVGIDGEVSGGQIDHRLQVDAAAVAEQGA